MSIRYTLSGVKQRRAMGIAAFAACASIALPNAALHAQQAVVAAAEAGPRVAGSYADRADADAQTTHAQRQTVAQTNMSNLNCTLRLTNDHVSDTIMMQHSEASAPRCKARCAKFARNSFTEMAEQVSLLRYTCRFNGRMVDARRLK